MPIPPLDRVSVEKALESLIAELPSIKGTRHDSTKFDVLWNGHRFTPKIVVERTVEIQYGKPLPRKIFSGGKAAGQANVILSRLGLPIVPKASDDPVRLPLALHGRYGRKEIYAVFGTKYDPQQRHLPIAMSWEARQIAQ